jgi:hypothetical protein
MADCRPRGWSGFQRSLPHRIGLRVRAGDRENAGPECRGLCCAGVVRSQVSFEVEGGAEIAVTCAGGCATARGDVEDFRLVRLSAHRRVLRVFFVWPIGTLLAGPLWMRTGG